MSQAILSDSPYLNSNLFSNYYLDERVQDLDAWDCDDEAEAVFEDLRELYELECDLLDAYNEDELLDSWIDEVLDTLGFGTLAETTLPDGGGYNDRLLFDSAERRREAAFEKRDGRSDAMYGLSSALLEAKQWDADFTKRFSERRSYRDASHQIKYYLERTPETVQWGVLTNGRKWRLYGTKNYETETFYEVDLPELLESGDLERFKYFYVFFRPAAFRRTAGKTFLDTVWNESETAAQDLGGDLQDNVFTALRVLGKGFVETNDLGIDPDDDAALDELKEQSLVLLYRLMFVLYAESRHLIDPSDPEARAEYLENFSLEQLRAEILAVVDEGRTFESAYSSRSKGQWRRLQDLFELIDEGEEDLGIPPYNGGLFDHDEHAFLTEHDVADEYLAEVIYRLSTTEADDGSFVPADYADLDTRHLGTIYEGLLEHEFRIAGETYAAVSVDDGQVWKPATEVSAAEAVETVEEGGLYVVNDDGERKATGAYYTPDYVVTYIVEETVDPLVADVKADLDEAGLEPGTQDYVVEFWRRVKGLKVLDPAMGSGHFLTKATGYLSERVMEEVRELETATLFNEEQIRREVSKECIYGVDLNGMAVELAKLSMWLETLATDQPLAFLDHHLKAGNSLVGSDVTEVLSDDTETEGGQLTLTQAFGRVRQRTLEHVMDLVEDLLSVENETLEDIKSMEELYAEIRADPLYQRLFELANVHTAERFGCDVPGDAYERMAQAIESEAEWAAIGEADWFRAAQATADEEAFFHWELEFPEVFFGSDGERMEATGFDAVVGNPPWVATAGRSDISANIQRGLRSYLERQYEVAKQQFDLYTVFYERFVSLSRQSNTGIVVPDAILTREQNVHIRDFLLRNTALARIASIGTAFENVENGAAVLVTGSRGETVLCADATRRTSLEDLEYNRIEHRVFADQDANRFLIYLDRPTREILDKIEARPPLTEQITISRGEEIGKRSDLLDETRTKGLEPIVPGGAIVKYGFNPDEIRYIDPTDVEKERENYTSPKLVFRQTSDSVTGTVDTESRVTIKSAYNIHTREAARNGEKQILAVLNSKLLNYYHEKKHAAYRSVFPQINQSTFEAFPVPRDIDSSALPELVDRQVDQTAARRQLNLNLSDHLGNFAWGETLAEIGSLQPAEGSADAILTETTADKQKLGVTEVRLERPRPRTLTVLVGVRYKPEDPEEYDTDANGYRYVEPQPAFELSNLDETETELLEVFVPYAVDEANGFASFRKNATKTNSPVDRLEALTLPAVDDVRDGLERYLETKARADELDEKIEQTDQRIDEIVYELYGLTDEEIEIVEEAVGN